MQSKTFLAAAIIVPGLLALVTGAALADGVQIKNISTIDIDNLAASAPGKETWGDNLLRNAPPRSLDAGKTYVLQNLQPGTYDLKSYDEETGKECVIHNVKVTKSSGAQITKDMTAACGG